MDATVSGFKIEGDWEEVVKHGERITRALREAGVLNEGEPDDVDGRAAFEEWDDWRPKAHEALDDEINEKTAEQASVDEAEAPEEEAKPDDLPPPEAVVREVDDPSDDPPTFVKALAEGLGKVAEAASSASRDAMQKAEETVYKRVMTQMGPYYFDNGLVSANIRQTEDGDVELFLFEINVNDDELKDEVAERLEAMEDAEEDDLEVDVSAEDQPADADVEDLDLDTEAGDETARAASEDG